MIHHVFANKSNIGDWLSAIGIQSLLEPNQVLEHLCDVPFIPETLDRLSKIPKNDLIIIGGGGLFMDYFLPFWEGFRFLLDRAPFCLWGVGYCDMKRKPSRPPIDLMRECINKSQFCVVRDLLTHQLLSNCNLPSPIPCPSINAIAPTHKRGSDILHVDAYDNVGSVVYGAMVEILEQFAHQSARQYTHVNNIISAGSHKALRDTLQTYANAELVVSSRLHGCIVAVAKGKKLIAVSGDHKVESFMRTAKLQQWVLERSQIHLLPDYLEKAMNTHQHVRGFVEHAREENRLVAERVKNIARTESDSCK